MILWIFRNNPYFYHWPAKNCIFCKNSKKCDFLFINGNISSLKNINFFFKPSELKCYAKAFFWASFKLNNAKTPIFKKHQKQHNFGHFVQSVNSQLTCRFLPKISQKCELAQRTFSQNFDSVSPLNFWGPKKNMKNFEKWKFLHELK